MTIQENKLEIAKWEGKVEGFQMLQAQMPSPDHDKLLYNAVAKVQELKLVLQAAEKQQGVQGQLIFRILIKEDSSDFTIDTDFVASDEVKKKYGIIPGALTAADILLSVCENTLSKFGEKAKTDPAANQMLNRLALLQNILVEWAQKWGQSLLVLHEDKPKSQIILPRK